jgi:hypothetical protein
MKSAVQIAREALDSETCVCGKNKVTGNPFCLRCFYKLDKTLQIMMHRMMSQGFAEYYSEAVDYLRVEGVIKPAPSFEKIE